MKNESDEILNEVKSSSTLRLIRELTRWDLSYHKGDLDLIIQELKHRKDERKILNTLFAICLIQSNFGYAFSEHFYVFDEDEKETRRQLKLGIQMHLVVIILITLTLIFFDFMVPLILISLYCIWTIKLAIDWYNPIKKKIKTTANLG